MPRTGAYKTIIPWVAANPGATFSETLKAAGITHPTGLLSYLVKVGQLFSSGPPRYLRLYATKQLADLNHERIAAEADASKKARVKRTEEARRERIRASRPPAPPRKKKAQPKPAPSAPRKPRQAPPPKPLPTKPRLPVSAQPRPAQAEPVILPTTKITVAPTPRPRFAPEPGFAGVITSDWMLRRQGVASASA